MDKSCIIGAYFKGGTLDGLNTMVGKKQKMFPHKLDMNSVEWYEKTNKKVWVTKESDERLEAHVFRFDKIMKDKREPANNIRIATI